MKKSKKKENAKMMALERPGFVDKVVAGERKLKAVYGKNHS